ncbi:rRNA pseudouridine synthase [Candidatus Nomurabacteria bacterium]|nr:rRNA pseudouridine synthase [Candidatus Nomurabacteria bacterium]USN94472.1 MAG: rRNA pseudouridine synthase [Candidatus Nomurabacteria bacterium]
MTQNKPKKINKTRINKRLKDLGISTRKDADSLIEKGGVFINGKLAKLGDVVLDTDKITVKNDSRKELRYFAVNKPVGILTVGGNKEERDLTDVAKLPHDFFPVGRLDKDSSGLILMTNDGRITDRLLNPKRNHQKEYRVTVNKDISNSFLVNIKKGIKIGRERTKPALVRKVKSNVCDIVLTEGKNRQIRKMCAALGYDVKRLQRFRIENIELKNLKSGEKREIKGRVLEEFLKKLGL